MVGVTAHEAAVKLVRGSRVAFAQDVFAEGKAGFRVEHTFLLKTREGIRIENLVLVESAQVPPGGERAMLSFETLTLVPYDRRLIDVEALTSEERRWLDAYHARVREALSPDLDGPTRDWLEAATRPLGAV